MDWLGIVGMIAWNVVFYGAIVWLIVRLVRGRREGERRDQAVSMRRLFVYGLMLATLLLSAIGAVMVLQELAGASGDGDEARSALALGLALVIVAAPAYTLLLRYSRGRLQESLDERRSLGWIAYLNVALLVSLIVTIVTTHHLVEGMVGVQDFEVGAIAPVVVWGAVWAMHWFWLKAAYGLPGDVHLAAGSTTGLVTLVIGLGGLVYVAGDAIYTLLVDDVPAGHETPDAARWLIAAFLGAAVWSWHWLARYLHAERSGLWHTYVVVIGALAGLVATIGSAATIGYWALVWFVGDPDASVASEHFEYVPAAAAAVLALGAASWQYHRIVLQSGEPVERSEPMRTYDYVMSGAGLIATVVAVTLALVAAIEAITPDTQVSGTSDANRLILAITLGAIGSPLWWVFWSRIRHQVAHDPAPELTSTVRRTYLVALFGVGGIVVLISLIGVLYVFIEDLIEGVVGMQTLGDMRVGLALLITVVGVAWYHLAVFRSDRASLATVEPVVPAVPHHVVLIAPRDAVLTDRLADQLVAATGADLETWYRADSAPMPDIDLDQLTAEIDATDAHDVLVVVGPTGATLTPFEPNPAVRPTR